MISAERIEPEELDLKDLIAWARRIAIGISRAKHLFHYADLAESAALEALSRALRSFDPSRGSRFRSYAVRGIVGAVLDEIGPEAQRLSVTIAFDVADADEAADECSDRANGSNAPADALGMAIMDALVEGYAVEEIRLNGEAGLLAHEAVRMLRDHLKNLPGPHRNLIMLRYWDGQTWDEVGAALGISDRTARDHDATIRKHLRSLLLAGDDVRQPA